LQIVKKYCKLQKKIISDGVANPIQHQVSVSGVKKNLTQPEIRFLKKSDFFEALKNVK